MGKSFQFVDLVGVGKKVVQRLVQKTCEKKRAEVTRKDILLQIRDSKVAEFARQGATKKLNS